MFAGRPQEQVEQRVKDIDTAIDALRKQIAALEAEKTQLLSGAAPAAAMENTARADQEAASYVSRFDDLPPSLREAKNADGCTALANVIVDQATLLANTAASIKSIIAGESPERAAAAAASADDAAEHRDALRQRLEKTKAEASQLRRDIVENAPSLSLDLYGCQLLARFLETSQKYADATGTPRDVEVKAVVVALAPHIKVVALINHGSRLLQRVADVASSVGTAGAAEALIAACLPHLVDLASEANGSHLLLRLVGVKFQGADRTALFRAVAQHTLELASSRHGCGFLQRSIESCVDDELRRAMIAQVLDNVTDLVHDPFGNYVLQFILDTKQEEYIEQVVRSLLHHVATFARNKFGSNVIERCVRLASEDVRQLLIDELTDPSVVEMLVRDEFANYVIQTAIVAASDAQFLQIQSAIRPFLNVLRTSPHGAKIESRMTRRVKDMQRSAAHARNRGDPINRAAQAQSVNSIFMNGRPQQQQHHHHHHHHNRNHQQSANYGNNHQMMLGVANGNMPTMMMVPGAGGATMIPTLNFAAHQFMQQQQGQHHQHQHQHHTQGAGGHGGQRTNNPYLTPALLGAHQQQGGTAAANGNQALMLASMATSAPHYAAAGNVFAFAGQQPGQAQPTTLQFVSGYGGAGAGAGGIPTLGLGALDQQQQQQQQQNGANGRPGAAGAPANSNAWGTPATLLWGPPAQ